MLIIDLGKYQFVEFVQHVPSELKNIFGFSPGSSTILMVVKRNGMNRLMSFIDEPFERPDALRPSFHLISGHLDFITAASEQKKLESKGDKHEFRQALRPDRIRNIHLLVNEKGGYRSATAVIQFEDSVFTASLNQYTRWTV